MPEPDTKLLVNDLVSKLQRRKIEGSRTTAKLTAEVLRSVISQHKAPQTNLAASLSETVKNVGARIIDANPVELAVGNIVRRVLHIIREEDLSVLSISKDGQVLSEDKRSLSRQPSLRTLLECTTHSATSHSYACEDAIDGNCKFVDNNAKSWKLKRDVIAGINELIEDIEACHDQIAEQAIELIHQNEVILTFGHSRTVMKFLCAAKKKRSFRVFVAEGAPKYQGQDLAKDLAARGLQTTLITDSTVFALIARVNMVIVGVHAIMANGGVIGPVGLNMVALAAKKHAVPFVVVAGIHKLCPHYPQNPGMVLNEMKCPSELLNFQEFSECMDFGTAVDILLHVANRAFDYVPPELVSLIVTDIGGHNPSFIYRLIADYYSMDDLVLQETCAS